MSTDTISGFPHEVESGPEPGRHDDWTDVCGYPMLLPERGVAALVDGVQVALFRTYDGTVHAISNYDPFSRAYVLSRGIVGTRGDVPTVASPMHKQVFDLRTGICLDDPEVSVEVYGVRVRGDRVAVRVGIDAATGEERPPVRDAARGSTT